MMYDRLKEQIKLVGLQYHHQLLNAKQGFPCSKGLSNTQKMHSKLASIGALCYGGFYTV